MGTIHSAEMLNTNETAKNVTLLQRESVSVESEPTSVLACGNDFAPLATASRLPSFGLARWVGTTAVDVGCGQIGLLFRLGDGSRCRLRLDVASARHLAETIEDSFLRAGYPSLENV